MKYTSVWGDEYNYFFCDTISISRILSGNLDSESLNKREENFRFYGGCVPNVCALPDTSDGQVYEYLNAQDMYIGYIYGCMGNFVIEKLRAFSINNDNILDSYIVYKDIRIHPGSQIVVFIPGIGYANALPKINSESSEFTFTDSYDCRKIFLSQKLKDNPICDCSEDWFDNINIEGSSRLALDDNIENFFYPSDITISVSDSDSDTDLPNNIISFTI